MPIRAKLSEAFEGVDEDRYRVQVCLLCLEPSSGGLYLDSIHINQRLHVGLRRMHRSRRQRCTGE